MGSRGLFDMVWLHGGPSTNLRRCVPVMLRLPRSPHALPACMHNCSCKAPALLLIPAATTTRAAGRHSIQLPQLYFKCAAKPNCRELYSLGYVDKVDPALVASQLAALAGSMGAGNLPGTPLAQQLAQEGRGLSPMQDVGDNTALVVYVQRQ